MKNKLQLFKNIKLLALDVDGVLTKGEIIYDSDGRELKIFNVKDGLGIFLLYRCGIKTIIVTAKDSPVVRRRAKDMRIAEVFGGVLPKENILPQIIKKYSVKAKDICFIADDVIDMGLMKKVGFPITVADAPLIVKQQARYVTKNKGGEGAVREVVDFMIKAKKLEKKAYNFSHNLLLFLLVILGWPFLALAQQTTTTSTPQKIKDFYLSNYKENGLQDWEMKGEEAIVYEKHVDIDKMNATYYSSNDTVKVSSQKAMLNKESMDVFLKDDVHIENRQGVTLDTESLDWNRANNTVTTDEWVKASGQAVAITAQGMTADTALKKVDFEQKVETIITDTKSGRKPTVINCTGPLEIEYTKGRAIFNQNVVVDGENGKLFCDKATAFFDAKQKKMVKIVAVGRVKILKDDNVTFARQATYYAKDERIVLKGNPKVLYFPKEGQKMLEF